MTKEKSKRRIARGRKEAANGGRAIIVEQIFPLRIVNIQVAMRGWIGMVFDREINLMISEMRNRRFLGLGFSVTSGMEDADMVVVGVNGNGRGFSSLESLL
jgi:hypothetical protein